MTDTFLENFDVVIVGGGPRAVSLVERLTARLAEEAKNTYPRTDGRKLAAPLVRVAVVDAVEVGPGSTWRTDQTGQFLNNTPISETTLYPDESTPIDGPLGGGPTLVEWVRDVAKRGSHEVPWVVEEARGLTPDSFSTRRLQGVYYAEQLARAEAAGFVSVARVIGVAEGIEYGNSIDDGGAAGPVRTVRLADGRRLRGRTVVLAQGMIQSKPGASVRAFVDGAERLGLRYIEPGMPAERPWHEVPAGENCVVRGLGANFFDIVAELSAGRGGQFEPVPGDPLGRLRYLPSGREPRLWAVSRRGVPYRAKGLAGPEGKPCYGQAVFATPQWFDALDGTSKPLHFGQDVWPTLAAEFGYAFAAALAARDASAVPAGLDALREDLRAAIASSGEWGGDGVEWGSDVGGGDGVVVAGGDAASAANARIDTILAAHIDRPEGHPEAFRLDLLQRPTRGEPVSEEEWDRYISELIEVELDAIAHPLESPRQAVNLAMAAVRGRVGQFVAKGLIEGRSTVAEVQGWFDGHSLALASGPPGIRVRQAIALVEAGFLHFVGPLSTVEIDESERCFTASSPLTGISVRARTFVEARMSKGKVTHTDDPLIQSLLKTGRARIHRLPVNGSPAGGSAVNSAAAGGSAVNSAAGGSAANFSAAGGSSIHAGTAFAGNHTAEQTGEETGGDKTNDTIETIATQSIEAIRPDSLETPLALVAADGLADPHVLVLGIPASTTQPGSAIGAAPGVPSPLLAGADIAARSILAGLAPIVPNGGDDLGDLHAELENFSRSLAHDHSVSV